MSDNHHWRNKVATVWVTYGLPVFLMNTDLEMYFCWRVLIINVKINNLWSAKRTLKKLKKITIIISGSKGSLLTILADCEMTASSSFIYILYCTQQLIASAA